MVLRVLVNERGLLDEVQVHTSSGYSRLDTIAQSTRQCRFVPARLGETTVAARRLVPMTSDLRISAKRTFTSVGVRNNAPRGALPHSLRLFPTTSRAARAGSSHPERRPA